jgi:hypothetical protein
VVLYLPGGEIVRMSAPAGSSRYSARVEMPRDFDERILTIAARDRAQPPNRAPRQRIVLRLMPICGPRVEVSNETVANIQRNLACLQIPPGPVDGALGRMTCGAIAQYLGDRGALFNNGSLPWERLDRELAAQCLAATPVVIDAPSRVSLDADRTSVSINLAPSGVAQTVRVFAGSAVDESQSWRGTPLTFNLPMPAPGSETALQAEALSANGRVLARTRILLARPSVRISVSPAGPVVSEGQSTRFSVSVERGRSAVARIEARPSYAPATSRTATREPVAFDLPAPEPGARGTVSFVALDARGGILAETGVTVSAPAPVIPPSLSLGAENGPRIDADAARLTVVLENPGATANLILRSGASRTELARRGAGSGAWTLETPMPPPGQQIELLAQAVDRTGRVLAQDALRLERPAVALSVWPDAPFEADTDGVTAQIDVTRGASWIERIIARQAGAGPDAPVLAEAELDLGRARLPLEMPAPGAEQEITLLAMGRDGAAYAPTNITLIRPGAVQPTTLQLSSPDGFAVDAAATRLAVEVINPARTAEIVVLEAGTGAVLVRASYAGTDWLAELTMPEPGANRPLRVEARDSEGITLAASNVTLSRPAALFWSPENWSRGGIAALVIGSVLLGCVALFLRRGARRKGETARTVPPMARPVLRARADPDPRIALEPAAPPALVLRTEPDTQPQFELESEEELTG